jgi:hypothetical protein
VGAFRVGISLESIASFVVSEVGVGNFTSARQVRIFDH